MARLTTAPRTVTHTATTQLMGLIDPNNVQRQYYTRGDNTQQAVRVLSFQAHGTNTTQALYIPLAIYKDFVAQINQHNIAPIRHAGNIFYPVTIHAQHIHPKSHRPKLYIHAIAHHSS